MKKIEIFDIVIYTVISFFVVIMIYPFLNVFAVSFSDYSEYVKNPMMIFPRGLNTDSYKYIFMTPNLFSSYINTIFVVLSTVSISIVVLLLAAYPLSKQDLKGKKFIMNLMIFSMLFNGGLIPNFILIKTLGIYNTLWALILPVVFGAYNLILVKNFIESLPSALFEAAKIDGASEFYVLLRIVAPLSVSIIATISMFIAVSQWNSYFSAVIYTSSPDKWTLQLFLRELIMKSNMTTMYDAAEEAKNVMPETIKYAGIIVVMAPILCVYPFVQRYFVKGVMVGAVKG